MLKSLCLWILQCCRAVFCQVDAVSAKRIDVSVSDAVASDARAYVLQSVTREEARDVQLALSTRNSLSEAVKAFHKRLPLRPQHWNRLSQALASMIYFLVDSDSKNPLLCEDGIPIRQHQQMFRELRVMDCVAAVLCSPFLPGIGAYTIEELDNSSPLAAVCRLCYHIVLHFSRVRFRFSVESLITRSSSLFPYARMTCRTLTKTSCTLRIGSQPSSNMLAAARMTRISKQRKRCHRW
jgi:hypothetical protein